MRMLKVNEVALKAGVSRTTIVNWCDKGLLEYYRLPTGARIFKPEDVEKLLKDIYGDADEDIQEKFNLKA